MRGIDGRWYVISGATGVAVFPNSYQVTFSIAPLWARDAAIWESIAFRIEGRLCSRAYVDSVDGASLTMMMLVT